MNWWEKYCDIPFKEGGRDKDGADCAGLVLLALKNECKINALDFADYKKIDFYTKDGHKKLAAFLEKAMSEWKYISGNLKEFDLVRITSGQAICHVGIYIKDNYFLHINKDFPSIPRIDKINDPEWEKRIFEFRRHKALS